MDSKWIYAKLSEAAKKAGGPEAFVESYVKIGKKLGRKEILCFFPVVFISGGIFANIINDIRKKQNDVSNKSDMELIVEGVAAYYNLNKSDLLDGKPGKEFSLPRQVAFYLCMNDTEKSADKIGEYFNCDNSLVIHGNLRIKNMIDERENEVIEAVKKIRKKSLTARKVQI